MSLKCCNKVCQILEEIDLLDTVDCEHRFLIVGRCRNPKCGALRAQLIAYDKRLGRFVKQTFNSKDVKKVVEAFKLDPRYEFKSLNDSHGTYANQHWIYGETRNKVEQGQTFIEHYACNFNGEKTLVTRKALDEPTSCDVISN